MNERLKELRNALGLNMRDFSARLKMSYSAISLMESGERAITDRFIVSLVHEYNVSETWLRSGEGEMFLPLNRDEELAKIANNLYESDPSELTVKLMRVVAQMSESEVELLVEVARKIAKEFEAKE